MVIVSLRGGLGNQMFQYATGRRLALKNKLPLKLDISWYHNNTIDTPRKYCLNKFRILEDFASTDEVNKLTKNNSALSVFYKFTDKLSIQLRPNYVREKHFNFDPNILLLKGDVYLHGTWASDMYFCDIKDIILNEFILKFPSDDTNLAVAKLINSVNSISLHVRRGDYVTSNKTNNYHGICPVEYYISAANNMSKRVDNPHFFIFSDDPEWVKANLFLDYPLTYVDHNDDDHAHEDLNLISLCKHNIIANSTFSWWGAWLNKNLNKIVYAPTRWFNNSDIDSSDLIPATWERL